MLWGLFLPMDIYIVVCSFCSFLAYYQPHLDDIMHGTYGLNTGEVTLGQPVQTIVLCLPCIINCQFLHSRQVGYSKHRQRDNTIIIYFESKYVPILMFDTLAKEHRRNVREHILLLSILWKNNLGISSTWQEDTLD